MIQSKEEIISLCKRYDITNYTINLDGSIDVDGEVELYNDVLTELPLKFNTVTGNFDCSLNNLTSLKGAPEYVGGRFWCHMNPLEHTKENLEILSRYDYNLDFIKMYYPNLYNMIIAAKRLNNIINILI